MTLLGLEYFNIFIIKKDFFSVCGNLNFNIYLPNAWISFEACLSNHIIKKLTVFINAYFFCYPYIKIFFWKDFLFSKHGWKVWSNNNHSVQGLKIPYASWCTLKAHVTLKNVYFLYSYIKNKNNFGNFSLLLNFFFVLPQ